MDEWNGRLANTDRTDLRRFDQLDLHASTGQVDAQGGRRLGAGIVHADQFAHPRLDFDGKLGSGATGWVVIDAGDPDFALDAVIVDIDGQPRVLGDRPDIGCDEAGNKEPDPTPGL